MTSPAQQVIKTHGKVWIGSPTDIRVGKHASDALKIQSDAKYWDETTGITKIDEKRWQQAQKYELTTWQNNHQISDDRNKEHATHFNNYKAVPQNLGHVIEFGCGPFTQLQTIMTTHTAQKVTLLDPLINQYLNHPHCFYKGQKIQKLHTTLLPIKAEDCKANQEFNTAICINVIEHVKDAKQVFEVITKSLKIGGTIIFADRFYDGLEIEKVYDVGHPIRVMQKMFIDFAIDFETIYSEEKPGDAWYFIGTRVT